MQSIKWSNLASNLDFAQIYRFLVLLGRKKGLLGIGVARLSLVFDVSIRIIDICSVFMVSSIECYGQEVFW